MEELAVVPLRTRAPPVVLADLPLLAANVNGVDRSQNPRDIGFDDRVGSAAPAGRCSTIAIATLDILVSIAKCLLHARKAAVVMVNV